jgi:hypothetical protein
VELVNRPECGQYGFELARRSRRARPLDFGEPWASSVHRIAARDPIGIEFEVIEDDKRVIVHGVFAVG